MYSRIALWGSEASCCSDFDRGLACCLPNTRSSWHWYWLSRDTMSCCRVGCSYSCDSLRMLEYTLDCLDCSGQLPRGSRWMLVGSHFCYTVADCCMYSHRSFDSLHHIRFHTQKSCRDSDMRRWMEKLSRSNQMVYSAGFLRGRNSCHTG